MLELGTKQWTVVDYVSENFTDHEGRSDKFQLLYGVKARNQEKSSETHPMRRQQDYFIDSYQTILGFPGGSVIMNLVLRGPGFQGWGRTGSDRAIGHLRE